MPLELPGIRHDLRRCRRLAFCCARAIIRPCWAIMAPTGTSPKSAAVWAQTSASRISCSVVDMYEASMTVVPTLNYIEFAVKDMAQAKTFWRRLLVGSSRIMVLSTANSQIASKRVAFLLVPMCDQAAR